MSFADLVRKHSARIFYGWWIVLAGFFIQALNGGLLFHAFSAYILPLQGEFGWSRAQLSGAFSMARAESGILGPLQGWLIDRYGPRAMMCLGIALFSLGFVLFSRMDSLATFYLSFALLALGSSLGGFMPIGTTITNWFVRQRTTALGISMTGMGAGGLLIPLVVLSLSTYGWRDTALISGILILVVGMPVSLLMRHRPEPYGFRPDGAPPEEQRTPGKERHPPEKQRPGPGGLTARQALRTPAFWLISITHSAALLVVGGVMLHQIPHMVEGMGLSEEMAASNVALLLGITIAGQLGGGYIGDRMDKRKGIFACMWMHALALIIFAYATSALGAVLFAVLHGMAWGVRGPMINAMRADYFGRAFYATISGFASLIVMIGMTVGPLFAGFMHDLSGDYQVAFLVLAFLAVLGSGAILLARPPVLDGDKAGPLTHSP